MPLNKLISCTFVLLGSLALAVAPFVVHATPNDPHVLVISIDGMHAVDLALFVKNNTNSTMA